MYVLENYFAHLPFHLYTTQHAVAPPPPPCTLGAVYIIAMKSQVLEILVYCCMFVAIKHNPKIVLLCAL
jgi:hypothetical protein